MKSKTLQQGGGGLVNLPVDVENIKLGVNSVSVAVKTDTACLGLHLIQFSSHYLTAKQTNKPKIKKENNKTNK